MRYPSIFILGLVLWFSCFQLAAAEPIVVITGALNPLHKLSLEQLKLIYLRKMQVDEQGNRWIPTNLPVGNPLRQEFSSTLFSMLPEDQEHYWNAQYFHGITPPPVMSSEEAVLRFVSSTPGAIGYVQQSHSDERVKIILTLSPPKGRD